MIQAHGKILLFGEYFAVFGGTCLALSSRRGQSLEVKAQKQDALHIKSYDYQKKLWWQQIFTRDFFRQNSFSYEIEKILLHLGEKTLGYTLNFSLNYPQNWGLGSSATLMSLLAQWQETPPFTLFTELNTKGSGYDLIAAQRQDLFTYQRCEQTYKVEKRVALQEIKKYLYLVFPGYKTNTNEQLKTLKKSSPQEQQDSEALINEALVVKDLKTFEDLIKEYKKLVSKAFCLLDFPWRNYPYGVLKPLGAWGGDVLLATSKEDRETTRSFFQQRWGASCYPLEELCYV